MADTPGESTHARRSYESEQFVVVGDPVDLDRGLPAIEYRRSLAF